MTYADFNHVAPQHREIDGRCMNWARWAVTNTRTVVQPMFRLYRSAEVWDHDQNQQKPLPIDPIDAMRVEKAVQAIPDKPKLALRWFYIVRAKPVAMCKELGVSRQGLAELVHDGRSMLLNRRI